ncbi:MULTISPECIES: NAD(P)-dependent oxidoreductase [Acinetobacter]|uniref:NAD(P)-dependent oxidoreductase n=2 Tax=Gammaproteobacteria TaxID=1236 RepID=A0A7T7WGL8_9GAMM|nr:MULTISPECIES: NAD(P)-dependent oxidoreductase [Acinetobacter]NHB64630.1 NAD(P)-dependent oxidoreductase [Acinetobacter sp. GFQ9D191M]NHB99100.1 NAD(P)-dependent oxidoreductase [Acinetobacter sp. GFQ9D192M]QQN86954.1 NAD(P)-dependent oxidoreductase [Acinetobacter variabilis]WKT74514.1 NAD(P)-dependent oxidoreductase [Acinetobacter variabilis]WPC33688.1 NAD(P)-dependent oxidoreductase [Acinetobacter sp. YWS30-1]
MIQSVAFIGLGAMGYRMAAHLPKHFETVYVWNRTFAKAEEHAAEYGTQAVALEQAVQADIIFSCLPTSADVEALVQGLSLKAGSIWVDCTSGVPDAARRLEEALAEQGVIFLDAPVSGQTIGAENGTLTVMVGGNAEGFEKALPAMQAFGKLIKHVGTSGAGFAVKAVNNMLLAVNLCAAAEGFTTLKAHGVDLNEALDCINASSGKSNVTETVLPQRVLNRSFPVTFALPLLAKDTGIALDLARDAKLAVPLLALGQSLVQAASNLSDKNSDFSSAVKMYESWSNITIE